MVLELGRVLVVVLARMFLVVVVSLVILGVFRLSFNLGCFVLLILGSLHGDSILHNSVVLQGQKIILQWNLPDIFPVAAVVQIGNTGLLVDNERGINCVRLIEWGTLVLVASREKCTMVLPRSLLDILGRCNTNRAVTAAGGTERVEAVELALPLNNSGSPGPCCVPVALNNAVLGEDGTDLLPRAVQVGCFQYGDVHASLNQVEGTVGFQEIGIMCRDIGVVGKRVFVGKGEGVGEVPDLHVREHLDCRWERYHHIADGCQRQQICRESDHCGLYELQVKPMRKDGKDIGGTNIGFVCSLVVYWIKQPPSTGIPPYL